MSYHHPLDFASELPRRTIVVFMLCPSAPPSPPGTGLGLQLRESPAIHLGDRRGQTLLAEERHFATPVAVQNLAMAAMAWDKSGPPR